MQVYYDDSVLVVSTSNCNISTSWCSTVITDLAPYTSYAIKVSCSTGAGEGPLTNAINVTTTIGSMFHNCFLKDQKLLLYIRMYAYEIKPVGYISAFLFPKFNSP